MNDEIDFGLKLLQRVKNCNKAYMKLLMLKDNAGFIKEDRKKYRYDESDIWIDHIHKTICDCINLIEGEKSD